MAGESLSFGPFTLDPGAGTLRRAGKSVAVGQRGTALLRALIEAEGEAVAKSDLMQAAWPGVIVEESNLSVQIAVLRKALGDDPDGQDWITTVPRLGYRLLKASTDSMLAALQPSLAVLPFENLGIDEGPDWFADGAVNDIITALSRYRSFAVIARNSSFTYKDRAVDVRQVGRELGVRYVLDGSLRRAGGRLRIAAQLVDAVSGAPLWAQYFDGTVEDVFDFQDRITENVASIVGSEIEAAEIRHSRRERPGSIAVYDIQLQAEAAWNFTGFEADHDEAYALLMQALQLEPDNPLTLAQLAWALSRRAAQGGAQATPGEKEEIVEFAHRALARAAGDPLVMAYCGNVLLHTARDYDLAMATFQAAVEANPNNLVIVSAAGVGYLHCGDIEEALALFRRADRLSPRDQLAHVTLTGIAHALLVLGDYTEALAAASRSLAFNPDYLPTYWMLIAASAHLGRMDQAHRYLAAYRKLAPEASLERVRAGQPAKDPTRLQAILDGLRLAGLPEE